MVSNFKQNLKIVKEFFDENKAKLTQEEQKTIQFIFKKFEIQSESSSVEDKNKSEEMKNQGNNLFKEGKLEEALEFYNKALSFDSKNYLVYSNRALVYMKLDQIDKAVEDCLLGIEIEPKFVKFYIRLAMIYSDSDRSKANEYIEKGLSYEPNNSILLEMKNNQKEEAEESSFDPSTMDSLLKNKGLQDMVQSFVKDKSPEELNAMMNSVLGKLGKK